MSRWFRFYADAMRNPKVLRLSDKDFRLWVRLLAVASENDGFIAPAADLRLVLAMRLDHLDGGLNRLIRGGLIDPLGGGYEPHGWNKFQYKSDSSTERVQKHRAKGNVSETPPDTETDTEDKKAKASLSSAGVEKPGFPKPDWADPQPWADFLANRRRKKLANTATAYKHFLASISRLTDDEWPPGRLLEHAAARGWGGIYDPKESLNGRHHPPPANATTREIGERVAARFSGTGDGAARLLPSARAAGGDERG